MQPPLLEQSTRAGVRAALQQKREVVGRIDVERDARQAQNARAHPAFLCRAQVRQETVVAEAQRNRIGGRTQDGIGSAVIARRHDGEGISTCGPMRADEFANVLRLDQRHVAGQGEHGEIFRSQLPCRHCDRAAVSGVCAVADDGDAVASGERDGSPIERDDENAGKLGHPRHGGEHVLEHGQRQFAPPCRVENTGEALLGLPRILDRHDRADFAFRLHAAAFASASARANTCRANPS